eukprot:1160071-Pelagomonas_calceolata.AAC.8
MKRWREGVTRNSEPVQERRENAGVRKIWTFFSDLVKPQSLRALNKVMETDYTGDVQTEMETCRQLWRQTVMETDVYGDRQ